MNDPYVERRDDAYVVAGTRVSLDSIVYAFLEGQSAEAIAQAFPPLTLEQVYGAITYYLAHRDELDQYLEARRKDFAALARLLAGVVIDLDAQEAIAGSLHATGTIAQDMLAT